MICCFFRKILVHYFWEREGASITNKFIVFWPVVFFINYCVIYYCNTCYHTFIQKLPLIYTWINLLQTCLRLGKTKDKRSRWSRLYAKNELDYCLLPLWARIDNNLSKRGAGKGVEWGRRLVTLRADGARVLHLDGASGTKEHTVLYAPWVGLAPCFGFWQGMPIGVYPFPP